MKASKILLLFIVFIFFHLYTLNVYGAIKGDSDKEEVIRYETINPGSPFYVFKRLFEKIELDIFTRQKDQKAKFLSKLLDTRFQELVYVASDNIGLLEDVVNRYNSTAGTIISHYNNIDPSIKEQSIRYITPLENVRDKFHSGSAQWLLMQYAIDTTRRLQ